MPRQERNASSKSRKAVDKVKYKTILTTLNKQIERSKKKYIINNNKSCLYPAIDDISHYHDGTAYRIYQFTITIYQFLHTVFTNQPDKEVEIQR